MSQIYVFKESSNFVEFEFKLWIQVQSCSRKFGKQFYFLSHPYSDSGAVDPVAHLAFPAQLGLLTLSSTYGQQGTAAAWFQLPLPRCTTPATS
jgi:hypothetical protein